LTNVATHLRRDRSLTRRDRGRAQARGPNRLPIVAFFDSQATESLAHARAAGEILTGLDGHPTLSMNIIEDLEETGLHKIVDLIRESMTHESAAIVLYKELLEIATHGESVYLEE
jgi:bacterioferritin